MTQKIKTTKPYKVKSCKDADGVEYEALIGFDDDAYQLFLNGTHEQLKGDMESILLSIELLEKAFETNKDNGGIYNRARSDLAYSWAKKAELEKSDQVEHEKSLKQADCLSKVAYGFDKKEFGCFDYAAWWARAFYFQTADNPKAATEIYKEADELLFKTRTEKDEKRNNFRTEYLEALAWEAATFPAGTWVTKEKQKHDKMIELISEVETPTGYQLWSIAYAKHQLARHQPDSRRFKDALSGFFNPKMLPGHPQYNRMSSFVASLILTSVESLEPEEAERYFAVFAKAALDNFKHNQDDLITIFYKEEWPVSKRIVRSLSYLLPELDADDVISANRELLSSVKGELLEYDAGNKIFGVGTSAFHTFMGESSDLLKREIGKYEARLKGNDE